MGDDGARRKMLTVRFPRIEPDEKTDNSGNKQEKADEIEVGYMLPQCPALMRVQVQEKEQQRECDASSGQINEEAPGPVQISVCGIHW